jgi:Helix-turn-helix domain
MANYILIKSAASLLDRHINTIYKWVRSGKLEANIKGKLYLFRPTDIFAASPFLKPFVGIADEAVAWAVYKYQEVTPETVMMAIEKIWRDRLFAMGTKEGETK